jgi:hypothetical protein
MVRFAGGGAGDGDGGEAWWRQIRRWERPRPETSKAAARGRRRARGQEGLARVGAGVGRVSGKASSRPRVPSCLKLVSWTKMVGGGGEEEKFVG